MIWGTYAKLAIAAAFILALGVVVYKADKNGYDRATGEFSAQRLQEANEANAAISAIQTSYRDKERKWAEASAKADKDYQKRIADRETQHLADLAAIDARTIILRDPGNSAQACGDSASKTATSTGSGNGNQGSQFSPEATRFLLSEASRADAVVEQLTACQAIIIEDRK